MSKKFSLLGEFLTKQKNAVAHKHRKKINVGQIMVLRKCKNFFKFLHLTLKCVSGRSS